MVRACTGTWQKPWHVCTSYVYKPPSVIASMQQRTFVSHIAFCLGNGAFRDLKIHLDVHLDKYNESLLVPGVSIHPLGILKLFSISLERKPRSCCYFEQEFGDLLRSLPTWIILQLYETCLLMKETNLVLLEKCSTRRLKQKWAQVPWADFPAETKSPEVTEGAAENLPSWERLCRFRPLVLKISFDVT